MIKGDRMTTDRNKFVKNFVFLPELEIRSGAFGRAHVKNIYNIIVPRFSEPPLRLTGDAWSADELYTYVKKLKKRLDTLVYKARDDESKLRKERTS